MAIKDWPEGERPRERLVAHGAQALSDAELIVVILGTGTTGRSALDLAREALTRFGRLSGLLASGPDELAPSMDWVPPSRPNCRPYLNWHGDRCAKRSGAIRHCPRPTRCATT